MSRWIEPVTLSGQHVKLVPLSVEHEAPIAAAAADGELWKLWYTSVPARVDQADHEPGLGCERGERAAHRM